MPDEVEDDVENGISEGENGKGSERGPGSASWPSHAAGVCINARTLALHGTDTHSYCLETCAEKQEIS